MWKIALVALLLAACGRRHPAAARTAPLTITVTHDGFVKFEGKAVTLDELGTLLAARRAVAPLEVVLPYPSVEEVKELAWGVNASTLPVLLDLEDDAAWGHASWVMTVLIEQKLWRLTLPGGRDFPLPVDCAICGGPPPDGKALLVCVLVLEDGAYALGDRTTHDVQEIGTWIDAAPREGTLCRIGQIRTQPRVAWRLVRPALDVLRSRGVKRIDFPIAIPSIRDRGRSPLPPRMWMPSASWSGVRVVGYWSGIGSYEMDDVEVPEEPAVPEELLALLNAHRQGVGLPAFGNDEMLGKAASLHAVEMDRLGYFGHFSPVPGNHSPSDRLAKFGWPEERRHAELLAKAKTAGEAFDAILAKPGNAAILADPVFKVAGVAQSGDCWVVLLGAER